MKKLFCFSLQISFTLLILLAFSLPARAQTIVCLETNLDEICMELLETEAPVTAQNFLAYVAQGSYRNTFFHFSSKGDTVYIQAGRYAVTGAVGLDGIQEIFRRPPISNESSISNTRGTVAMIADDPSNPDSTTSQFIINGTDNSASLDEQNGGATVFARIIGEGMDMVDLIASFPQVAFDTDGLTQIPVAGEEIPVINSVRADILDVTIFDGDITDFENDNLGDNPGDDGSDEDPNGDNTDDETPEPGENETLYEDAVCVDSNVGEFCMTLFPEETPVTVQNFLNYINTGNYDDTIIHRSVPNFVIQGGGYNSSPLGTQISRDPAIVNEFNRSNLRGTVAMARVGGQINSATTEWFVNLVDNSQLDNVDEGFTVFGEIISGMSVVDEIGNLPRLDMRNTLGGAFGELPRSRDISGDVVAEDLVLVNRIYVTDVIVDDSGNANNPGDDGSVEDPVDEEPAVETTTVYSNVSRGFSLPVQIGNELYRVFMFQDAEASGLVFSTDTARIFSLIDIDQDRASMDLDSGILVIPSIKVGTKIFVDLEFTLTDLSTLSFKLTSFSRLQ